MGVHFDAFKEERSRPETPDQEPPHRQSLDPEGATKTAQMEWDLFSKYLRLEIAEEFEVPENVSACDTGPMGSFCSQSCGVRADSTVLALS